MSASTYYSDDLVTIDADGVVVAGERIPARAIRRISIAHPAALRARIFVMAAILVTLVIASLQMLLGSTVLHLPRGALIGAVLVILVFDIWLRRRSRCIVIDVSSERTMVLPIAPHRIDAAIAALRRAARAAR